MSVSFFVLYGKHLSLKYSLFGLYKKILFLSKDIDTGTDISIESHIFKFNTSFVFGLNTSYSTIGI